MRSISARLRRQVVERAEHRCEYCGLAQVGQEATFHIDHIVPRVAGGATTAMNLALACVSCSLRKEANRSGRDPQTGRLVALFHPRRQKWLDHFAWNGVIVVGLTATGRATLAKLQFNRPVILAIREEESERDGIHQNRRANAVCDENEMARESSRSLKRVVIAMLV